MKLIVFCDLLRTCLKFRGHLVAGMVRGADEVVVTAAPAPDDQIEQLHALGARFCPLPVDRTGINPLIDLRYLRAILSLLRRENPDAVFAFQPKASVFAALAMRMQKRRGSHVLFPGLGYLFSREGGRKDFLVRKFAVRLYKVAFRRVDTMFFQNDEDRQTLRELGIVQPQTNTLVVNGSGIPLDEFTPVPAVQQPLRFLLVGRLLREKGVFEFAEAAGELRKKYDDQASFHMLGPIDSNPAAIRREQIEQLVRDGKIIYDGVAEDVRPHLAHASVFVLPSYYMEGTPRSALEALAMARPIITTDSRGCRNTVIDGRNGFLVPVKNPAALAEAMEQFIRQPQLVVTMGRCSRELAERKFDVHMVNRAMLGAMGLLGEQQAANVHPQQAPST